MEKPLGEDLNSSLTPGPSRSGRGENTAAFHGPLVILYTANIRGDLALLPRLYTLIRRLKAAPYEGRRLLLDLGDSCAPDAWHCQATGGRSTLIVLDAMGYDAVNVSGFLTAEGREKLEGQVSVALIDHAHTWQDNGMYVTNGTRRGEAPGRPYHTHIVLTPATSTHIEGSTIYLASVNAGQVGMAQIGGSGNGKPVLLASDVFDLPATTPPDPTIAAAVEFVESEARYLQRKRGPGAE